MYIHIYKRIVTYTPDLVERHAGARAHEHTYAARAHALYAHIGNGAKISRVVLKESIIERPDDRLDFLPSCMVESCVRYHHDCVLA